MANWRVIEFCGETLVRLIEQNLARLGVANVDVGVVTASSFGALANTATPFISLMLYQVDTNAEMRNWTQGSLPDGTPVRQPLPLELNYLITAWGVRQPNDPASDSLAAREESRLLGAVLQALYENAEVVRGDLVQAGSAPGWADTDSLQLVLRSLPVETHYRIWDASEIGYRLSLAYCVRVTSLAPPLPPPAPIVVDAGLELVP